MIKYEYRVIDHDMFDENLTKEMCGMGENGWEIIRIFNPMEYKGESDGMFTRVFYKREKYVSTNRHLIPG